MLPPAVSSRHYRSETPELHFANGTLHFFFVQTAVESGHSATLRDRASLYALRNFLTIAPVSLHLSSVLCPENTVRKNSSPTS